MSTGSAPASLVLASASPRRRDLLTQIGTVPSALFSPAIDETPRRNEPPRDYARRMAHSKADTAINAHPGQVILAADTVVHRGRRILPQAADMATARRCLESLSGCRHRVLTAVVVHHPALGRRERLVETVVQFKRLSEAEIAAYLASGEWEGKAGGYAIQGLAGAFITHLNGSYTGVVGLPLHETRNLLVWAGVCA